MRKRIVYNHHNERALNSTQFTLALALNIRNVLRNVQQMGAIKILFNLSEVDRKIVIKFNATFSFSELSYHLFKHNHKS